VGSVSIETFCATGPRTMKGLKTTAPPLLVILHFLKIVKAHHLAEVIILT